ncbi:hypothetical protein OG589_32805 [Sphaerisporangium sp. NBC_01403]|uniref:hypothetical protein n=1 Tax=Sphaerisporangium sp. NBC_01403 TaxID=2903599 RepID=UPI00324EF861
MVNHPVSEDRFVPDWATCQSTSNESCIGIQAAPFDCCLNHLQDEELGQVLDRFRPGADIDVSGTRIDANLFTRIRIAFRGEHGITRFGEARQSPVQRKRQVLPGDFNGHVGLGKAQFSKALDFRGSKFDHAKELRQFSANLLNLNETEFSLPIDRRYGR